MFEVFKIFQTVDLVSENVRNRRDGSVQPSCARASQSQGLEDLQYSYVYISLLVIRIQNSFPDPEFFLSDPARMKMKINYNLFIFFGLWILRFWMLGPNMDRIRRIAGSGMNHSGFITLMVYGNILPVIFKRCFNLKFFNIKSKKAIENCKEETSGDH